MRNWKSWGRWDDKGTVGLVKRCREVQTGDVYAVKIIKTRDEEMIENIKREFHHLQKLSHKNIIRVHELVIDSVNGEIYLVMEYFEGREMFVLLSEIGHYNGELRRGDGEAAFYAAAGGYSVLAQDGGGTPGPQTQ